MLRNTVAVMFPWQGLGPHYKLVKAALAACYVQGLYVITVNPLTDLCSVSVTPIHL